MEKTMQKLTKEQDKAYKIFTDFLMKVINITDTLHTTPKQIPEHTRSRWGALLPQLYALVSCRPPEV